MKQQLKSLEDFLLNTECKSEAEFLEQMKMPSDDHEISIEDVEFVRDACLEEFKNK